MNTKSLNWLLFSKANFESLLKKLILWPRHHKNYELSGYVTAALLDYEDDRTILSIYQPKTNTVFPSRWITYKLTRNELIDFLLGKPEIVGKSEAETYILEYE